MACHLFVAKPLPEPMTSHSYLESHRNKLSEKSELKYKSFFVESAFQNVICELSAIFSGLNVLMAL